MSIGIQLCHRRLKLHADIEEALVELAAWKETFATTHWKDTFSLIIEDMLFRKRNRIHNIAAHHKFISDANITELTSDLFDTLQLEELFREYLIDAPNTHIQTTVLEIFGYFANWNSASMKRLSRQKLVPFLLCQLRSGTRTLPELKSLLNTLSVVSPSVLTAPYPPFYRSTAESFLDESGELLAKTKFALPPTQTGPCLWRT